MVKTNLPVDITDIREAPIDFHDIEMEIRDFYNSINLDYDEEVKNQCLDARSYIDSARILVKNLIIPEENKFIEPYQEIYKLMDENLGRVDKKLEELEEKNIGGLRNLEEYENKLINSDPRIRKYINFLIKCMEGLVYYPLKNALKKFKGYPDKAKTPELFEYKLFLELWHTSNSLGSLTSDKGGSQIKTTNIYEDNSGNTYRDKDKKNELEEIDTPKETPEEVLNLLEEEKEEVLGFDEPVIEGKLIEEEGEEIIEGKLINEDENEESNN